MPSAQTGQVRGPPEVGDDSETPPASRPRIGFVAALGQSSLGIVGNDELTNGLATTCSSTSAPARLRPSFWFSSSATHAADACGRDGDALLLTIAGLPPSPPCQTVQAPRYPGEPRRVDGPGNPRPQSCNAGCLAARLAEGVWSRFLFPSSLSLLLLTALLDSRLIYGAGAWPALPETQKAQLDLHRLKALRQIAKSWRMGATDALASMQLFCRFGVAPASVAIRVRRLASSPRSASHSCSCPDAWQLFVPRPVS